MNKQTLIGIAVGIALLIAIWYFTMKKEVVAPVTTDIPNNGNNNVSVVNPTEAQLQDTFKTLIQRFGPAIAKNIERIYRLETAHFKSGQYKATNSPGMLAFGENYPWGWQSLKTLWDNNSQMRPVGIVNFSVGGKVYRYLAFPGFTSAATALGTFLEKYGNRGGRWNADDNHPLEQQAYQNKLNTITTHYT